MSTDPGLDDRLRDALGHAADAMDPAVGSLLVAATARGQRRRQRRRAAMLAVILAVVAVPLGLAGLDHRYGEPEVVPAMPSAAELIGTWQTPVLPAADWADTYRRAGGSAAAAAVFLGPPMGGPATTYRIVLRVTATDWALFVSPDGRDLEAGWHGPYQIEGSRVRAGSVAGQCTATYEPVLAGDILHVSVVNDGCGDTDALAQRTIYETADFQRSPG